MTSTLVRGEAPEEEIGSKDLNYGVHNAVDKLCL